MGCKCSDAKDESLRRRPIPGKPLLIDGSNETEGLLENRHREEIDDDNDIALPGTSSLSHLSPSSRVEGESKPNSTLPKTVEVEQSEPPLGIDMLPSTDKDVPGESTNKIGSTDRASTVPDLATEAGVEGLSVKESTNIETDVQDVSAAELVETLLDGERAKETSPKEGGKLDGAPQESRSLEEDIVDNKANSADETALGFAAAARKFFQFSPTKVAVTSKNPSTQDQTSKQQLQDNIAEDGLEETGKPSDSLNYSAEDGSERRDQGEKLDGSRPDDSSMKKEMLDNKAQSINDIGQGFVASASKFCETSSRLETGTSKKSATQDQAPKQELQDHIAEEHLVEDDFEKTGKQGQESTVAEKEVESENAQSDTSKHLIKKRIEDITRDLQQLERKDDQISSRDSEVVLTSNSLKTE